jgi:hypothetical protein
MTKKLVHERAMFRAIELLSEANTRAECAEAKVAEMTDELYMEGYNAAKIGKPREGTLSEWLRGYDEYHDVNSQS